MTLPSARTRLLALTLCCAGCAGALISSTPPPVYYGLSDAPVTVPCTKPFHEGVRVWELTTETAYDRPEMVVVRNGGELEFSSAHQWIASPGTMVADKLVRDLSAGALFPRTLSSHGTGPVPLELSGRIFRFDLRRGKKTAHAELSALLSLARRGNRPQVLFRKTYDLVSEPVPGDDPEAFATAMSGLVAKLSRQLQEDLCAAASHARAPPGK